MNTASRAAAHAGLLLGLLLTGPLAHGQTPPPGQQPANPEPAVSQPAAPAAPTPAASGETAQATPPAPTPVAVVPPPRPTSGETVGALSDGDIRQALDLIRTNYVDSGAFTEEALNRATLQGLLERLGPGAIIESGEASTEPNRFLAEILDDRIGYIRLGSLSKDTLAEFDATLGNFAEKNLGSLILDLRATPASSDYELAAEVIKRLTPKGKMLFAVRRPSAKQERMFTSSQEPSFNGVLVTVVNRSTAGAGEVIAAVLRTLRNGMVVGQNTAGEAAEFAELPLRGGKRVRVAVGEVNLPGEMSIFPSGLKPDLTVAVPSRIEAEALRLGLEKGVSGLVFETERARLNEAALVAGVNPELDEVETYQKTGGFRKRPVSDATLQRAVDLITTINIFAGKPGR